MTTAVHDEAQAFLSAWFDTRRVIQALNFNRFQQEGLGATQFIVLDMIGEGAGSSAADLARRLNVDVTTTMRTAESLAARGLLRKRTDPSDRRRSLLALTAAGRRMHGRMRGAFIERVIAAFDAMSPKQRAGLVEGLTAFVVAAGGHRDLER